jgi:hypothetical protein
LEGKNKNRRNLKDIDDEAISKLNDNSFNISNFNGISGFVTKDKIEESDYDLLILAK